MSMMEIEEDPSTANLGQSVKYSTEDILPQSAEKIYPALVYPREFHRKPNDNDMKNATNWCKTHISAASLYSLDELFDAFTHGRCVIPAQVKLGEPDNAGKRKMQFVSANYICIDIDDTEEKADPVKVFYRLLPAGLFYTFSHGMPGKGNRFRLFYLFDKRVTNAEDYKFLSDALCSELKSKGLNADKRPPILPMRTGLGDPKINKKADPLDTDHYIKKGRELFNRRADKWEKDKKRHCNFTLEQIRDMIETIGPIPTGSASYSEWIKICLALKNMTKYETVLPDGSVFTDEVGRELCDYICDGERPDSFWDYELSAEGDSSVGSIYYAAKEHGWKPNRPVVVPEQDFADKKGPSLIFNEKNNIRPIAANFRSIIDYHFPGYFGLDEFSHQIAVLKKFPWDNGAVPRVWDGSLDDACLCTFISEHYAGLNNPQVMRTTFETMAKENSFHPVRDYLNALKWDGTPRLDTLYIDYLGAEDKDYSRWVARKGLVAAVARVMEPGCKFDETIVLTGKPGIGKSQLLKVLGKKWFSNSRNTFKSKDDRQMLQGLWIYEAQELEGFSDAGIKTLKAFFSTETDRFRPPYGKTTIDYPRQCVCFGSTNENDFLQDITGNRKYWPVSCNGAKVTKSIYDELPKEVDQIWAEAMTRYQLGEKIYLTKEQEEIAAQVQSQFMEDNGDLGLIEDFISKPITDDWYNLKAYQQINTLNGDPIFGSSKKVERERVCALEIAVLCFGVKLNQRNYQDRKLIKDINRIMSYMPGWVKFKNPRRFGVYGNQRGYKRIEGADK